MVGAQMKVPSNDWSSLETKTPQKSPAIALHKDPLLGPILEFISPTITPDSSPTAVALYLELTAAMPASRRPVLVNATLQLAREIRSPSERAFTLARLVKLAQPPLQQELALTGIATLEHIDSELRASVLAELIPYLAENDLAEVLTAIDLLTESERLYALGQLAKRLPPDQARAVLNDALIGAAQLTDPSERIDAYQALWHQAPENERAALSAKLVETLAQLRCEPLQFCERALCLLEQGLVSDTRRRPLIADLVAAISALQGYWRLHFTARCAPFLDESECNASLVETLSAIFTLESAAEQVRLVRELAPQLPPECRSWLRTRILRIEDNGQRVHGLIAILPHLSEGEHGELVIDLLEQLPALDQHRQRLALDALIPEFAKAGLRALIRLTSELGTPRQRARLAGTLVTHLGEDLLGSVLQEVASGIPAPMPAAAAHAPDGSTTPNDSRPSSLEQMKMLLQTLRTEPRSPHSAEYGAAGVFDRLEAPTSASQLAPEVRNWAIPYTAAATSLEALCLQTYELPHRPPASSGLRRDHLIAELQHSLSHLESYGRKLEKSGYLQQQPPEKAGYTVKPE